MLRLPHQLRDPFRQYNTFFEEGDEDYGGGIGADGMGETGVGAGNNDGSDSNGYGDGLGDNDNDPNPGGYDQSDFDNAENNFNNNNYDKQSSRENFGRATGENQPLGQEKTDYDTQNARFDGFSEDQKAADRGFTDTSVTVTSVGPEQITYTTTIFGIAVDLHSWGNQDAISAKDFSIAEEMAADVLEALNIGVNQQTVATVQQIAKAVIGYALTGPTLAVALNAISATANIANITGQLSYKANKDIQVAVTVVEAVAQFMGLAQVGINIASVDPVVGITVVSLATLDFMDTMQAMGLAGPGTSGVSIDGIMGDDGGSNDLSATVHSDTPIKTYNPIIAGKRFNRNTMKAQIMAPIVSIPKYMEQKQGDDNMTENFIEYRGGISNILAPHLIQKNEGSIFTNIDTNGGTMRSICKGTSLGLQAGRYKKFLEDNSHYFISDYNFSMAKLGNKYYLTTEHPAYTGIYMLVLNQLELTEVDLILVDLVAPTDKPIISSVIVPETYTATATLINIKNSSGVEETYTATITSDYQTGIQDALENNTTLTISGTCSVGTPNGRTIVVNINGISVNTTSSSEAFTVTITSLSFLSQELVRELWDTYQYAYTYYNDTTGFESIPIFSDTWLRRATSLKISNIKHINNTDVNKIRIYRIGGYSSVYRRITEIDNLRDDSLGEYIDNIDDLLTVSILDTSNASDIAGLFGLLEHKGTLFGFKNNQVYFSATGKPNIWSEFNAVRVGGLVTGLASVPLGVLIMTDAQQTYLLSGTTKSNFSLTTLDKTTGCLDYKSVQNVANSAIWLGYNGIMVSVGAAVQNLSKGKMDVSDIGSIQGSFSYNSIYYLFGSNYSLMIDFRYTQPAFKKLDIGNIYSMYKLQGKLSYILDTKEEFEGLYSQGQEATINYRGPAFIGQSYDLVKEFNKVNLVYKGTVTYTIYIDEVAVLSNTITSLTRTVEEIQIPTQSNEGLSLELGLVGECEVYSFRYIFSYLNNN